MVTDIKASLGAAPWTGPPTSAGPAITAGTWRSLGGCRALRAFPISHQSRAGPGLRGTFLLCSPAQTRGQRQGTRMAEIPSMEPGQLAATCLFGLEQEIHFSTIYTADLRNKLITAAKLHSHSVRLTSVTPDRDQSRRCQMAGRSGGSGQVDTPALLPKSSGDTLPLDTRLQPRGGLPA